MLSSQCLFCDHVNPTGAKFCNACGSPLNVKRCSRCGTINEQAAKNCVKCELEFPVLSTRSDVWTETPPVPSAKNTVASPADSEPLPFRLDSLDEFPKPAPPAADLTAAAQITVAPEPS